VAHLARAGRRVHSPESTGGAKQRDHAAVGTRIPRDYVLAPDGAGGRNDCHGRCERVHRNRRPRVDVRLSLRLRKPARDRPRGPALRRLSIDAYLAVGRTDRPNDRRARPRGGRVHRDAGRRAGHRRVLRSPRSRINTDRPGRRRADLPDLDGRRHPVRDRRGEQTGRNAGDHVRRHHDVHPDRAQRRRSGAIGDRRPGAELSPEHAPDSSAHRSPRPGRELDGARHRTACDADRAGIPRVTGHLCGPRSRRRNDARESNALRPGWWP